MLYTIYIDMNPKRTLRTGPKDITVAVRLDAGLHASLLQAADLEHCNLSDIIRVALVDKTAEVKKKHMDRLIEEEKLQLQLNSLKEGKDMTPDRLLRIQTLEDLRRQA